MSERRRRPRVLGEYELDGGAFGPARSGTRVAVRGEWGEQRDTAGAEPPARAPGSRLERGLGAGLGRPGSVWRAVLRRLATD